MRHMLSLIISFCVVTAGIPAFSMLDKPGPGPAATAVQQEDSRSPDTPYTTAVKPADSPDSGSFSLIDTFHVYDIDSKQVLDVSARDYVIGAVCAEMPASFETEALKAQAVAVHTYALRQALLHRQNPDDEIDGADFSNDCSKYQAFFTNDKIKEYYGDSYDEYYNKVAAAVDAVSGLILTCNNEPIIAAFHSMSSGTTESASNVWGSDISYLVPVDSPGDKLAPTYSEEYTFTPEELKARLISKYPDIQLGDDYSKWFAVTSRSDSGTVLEFTAGSITMSGNDLRSLFSLRSADFDVNYSEEKGFNIITKGFGHGVGMSQYGANTMAGEGKTYEEILSHYYTGAVISSI
ncbi:MAG: stage II sporulation protein D [Oscillospiraceae bacterium]|nr:stage II sporulation protein D [Oscillospiraceae bacterium]